MQLRDISILRCFAIISLVTWHSYCPYVSWNTVNVPPYNDIYNFLFTRLIPDANMPLFTILSGYLFYYLLFEKDKYSEFKFFFINKTKRLLIPFIILGIAINLLEYGKKIDDILYGIPNHLWYCLMLFYVFIICWLIEMKIGRKWNCFIALLSAFVVTYFGQGALTHKIIGGLFLPCYYYSYFYFGFLFRGYIIKKHMISLKLLFILGLLLYLGTALLINHHLLWLCCTGYFVTLFSIVNLFCWENSRFDKMVTFISKYSFGVYVFHQWILWNLTREPHCLFIVKPLLNYALIAPLIFLVFAFSISMFLTHFALKTKIGRFLLL